QDSRRSWSETTVWLYGRKVKVWYQSIDALWYSSAGSRLLRIVVVRGPVAAAATIAFSPPTSR
ncbi:MAG: hypothetical protein ACRD7E_27960, partial [Bryobacteraceae bacterium]